MKSGLKFCTSTAVLLVLSSWAYAADPATFEEKFEGAKPAVSAFNGKLDIGYAFQNYDVPFPDKTEGGYVIGSISAPLGQSFGLQIDGGYARLGIDPGPFSAELTGIGAHLFWRNPDKGLIGAYGHYNRIGLGFFDLDAWRYGVEAEAYLGPVSLEAFIGGDSVRGPAGSINELNADFRAAYYFMENYRVDVGVNHQFGATSLRVGTEALLPVAGQRMSLYANGAFSSDATTVRAGLRFYFGQAGKSLQARHREDDPATRLFDYFNLDDATSRLGGGGGGGGENPGCGGPEQPMCD